MDRIIAVNSNCYHGFSVEESLRGIAAAGFHWVELTATKGWTEHVFPDQSFERLLEVKALMKDLGLSCVALSGHCNLMDGERLVDFEKNMELAAFFGSRFIVSSVGEAHISDKTVSGIDTLAENIRTLLPQLERLDLTLVIETHGEHSTAAVLKEIVDAVGSPRVKINYDTANVVFYGDVNPEEDLSGCIDDVAYLHLKDKAGERGEWNFPALGEGYIRFPEIFSLLSAGGNESPFSIEIEFTEKGPSSVSEVDQAVKLSAEYLKGQGFIL